METTREPIYQVLYGRHQFRIRNGENLATFLADVDRLLESRHGGWVEVPIMEESVRVLVTPGVEMVVREVPDSSGRVTVL